MYKYPLVSVVSVNYNQSQVTCAMIESLQKVSYPNVEVIIVDNASPTDDPDSMQKAYPHIHLIKSSVNLGYAGGNNLGVLQARGEYILFLNNDTEVEPGFLEPLVDLFETNINAGIASPKILYYHSDKLIQYAGSNGINPWTGRSITIGNLEKDRGQHNVSAQTQLADGAAMMVPMRVIKHVGLMPEMYFLYYEELDWCEMIKRAGYSCHYVATSSVYHKESVSVGKESVLKAYYMNRNRLLFIRRNITGGQFITSSLVFLLAAVPKKALEYTFKFKGKYLKALLNGLLWNLTHLKVHGTEQYISRQVVQAESNNALV